VKLDSFPVQMINCLGCSMSDPSRSGRPSVPRASLSKVYLCGPITGLMLSEATGWRRAVTAALAGEAQIIDPTRDSPDFTRRSESATTRFLTARRLRHGKRTVARARSDIRRSDLVLACFLDAKAVSIGAVGEIFWAEAMGKPVVVVREDDNLHNHDMINEIAGWIFDDLDQAVEQVRRLIGISASR
jgi:nucleoside 2-deoxyribosyltransferase